LHAETTFRFRRSEDPHRREGETVLLIHGFIVDIMKCASGVIKALSDTFQVIAIDNRGHGQSDKPHDPAAYGMNMAEDSIRLLDHLKIRKAHVVGYSMGGLITASILTRHPERVRTAVMGGAGWNPPGQTDPLLLALADSLEQGKGIEPLIKALNPVGAPPPTPEMVEMYNKALLSKNDALALAAVVRNLVPEPTEAQIRANKVPVLALIGELDPLKSGDRLNCLMPHLAIVAQRLTRNGFASPEFINLRGFSGALDRGFGKEMKK
jgi:pimeloyl-ACP methyl ester carboxylesterase